MNRKLFSSLTASILISALGIPFSSNANSSEPVADQGPEADLEQLNLETASDENPASSTDISAAIAEAPVPPVANVSSPRKVADVDGLPSEVVKVGEQTSQSAPQTSGEVIAKIHPHQIDGRKAATLYVRNLPILTFTSSTKVAAERVKVGTQAKNFSTNTSSAQPKSLSRADEPPNQSLSTLLQSSKILTNPYSSQVDPTSLDIEPASDNPVWRATVIAARINQLYRDGVNANKITVRWDGQKNSGAGQERYLIKADSITIAIVDANITFANSTRNLENDALQATNRLRRLLGNAAPLRSVAGKPAWREQQLSFGPIRIRLTGFASWYGPGFHGNPSASGERFNQHAMTAAHRTLPFGTQVLVTNLHNGQSVVVRINDRGPFHGNRIIDLSTAAARILGLVQSGVAPVRLEVLDSRNAAAVRN